MTPSRPTTSSLHAPPQVGRDTLTSSSLCIANSSRPVQLGAASRRICVSSAPSFSHRAAADSSVPRSPDGEWWELADSSRGGQSYYYSESPRMCTSVARLTIDTLTGVTQWNRPDGDAFVIPLGLIQVSGHLPHNQSLTRAAQRSFITAKFTASRFNRERDARVSSEFCSSHHLVVGPPRAAVSPCRRLDS